MTAPEILAQFPARSALVVGDICLDRRCSYDPAASEPPRETGILRTAVVSTEVTPGAGGTVANNLAAQGVGRVAVLGVLGNDGFGYELRQALAGRVIDSRLLVVVPGLQTFTYTKVINAETGVEDSRAWISSVPGRSRRRSRRSWWSGSGRKPAPTTSS